MAGAERSCGFEYHEPITIQLSLPSSTYRQLCNSTAVPKRYEVTVARKMETLLPFSATFVVTKKHIFMGHHHIISAQTDGGYSFEKQNTVVDQLLQVSY